MTGADPVAFFRVATHLSSNGESHVADGTMHNRELTLAELLADPTVRTMMARDGVRGEDVERLFETLRGTQSRGSVSGGSDRHLPSPSTVTTEYGAIR